MMKQAFADEMKQIDRTAIEVRGIPSLTLMDNAAAAVVRAVKLYQEAEREFSVLVYCGVGNNGGDGFACARQLLECGIRADAVQLGNEAKMTADCLAMKQRFLCAGGQCFSFGDEKAYQAASYGCIVDALFGIGLSRCISGDFEKAIQEINQSEKPVIACDIPSGLHADTGAVLGCAVHADTTVTFSCVKPGLLWCDGLPCCGKIRLADIGIPDDMLPAQEAILPGKYLHYKGNFYEAVGLARHSETLEPLVVYHALYGNFGLWARPLSMWAEYVTVNEKTVRRFAYQGENPIDVI